MTLTDDSATNETLGAQFINDSIRTICNLQGGKLRFLEATKNMLVRIVEDEVSEVMKNEDKYHTSTCW